MAINPKPIKNDLEAEFNAGVSYAETVAVLFREASLVNISMKCNLNNHDMVKFVATLKELWEYIFPYFKSNEMKDLGDKITKLENEMMFIPMKNSKENFKKNVEELNIIKTELHIFAVKSNLIPYRQRMSDTKKLKVALLQ